MPRVESRDAPRTGPPGRTKADRLKRSEIEACQKYIQKVMTVGPHWKNHVVRLEAKYPNNIVNVYNELKADVNMENEMKRKRKDKLHASGAVKRSKHDLHRSMSRTSRDSDDENDDGASVFTAATFRTTGLTQAQLDRERGRPRRQPARPSQLSTSHAPVKPAHPSSSSSKDPEYATFSLSDDDDRDAVQVFDKKIDPFVAPQPKSSVRPRPVPSSVHTSTTSTSKRSRPLEKVQQDSMGLNEASSSSADYQSSSPILVASRPETGARTLREPASELTSSSSTVASASSREAPTKPAAVLERSTTFRPLVKQFQEHNVAANVTGQSVDGSVPSLPAGYKSVATSVSAPAASVSTVRVNNPPPSTPANKATVPLDPDTRQILEKPGALAAFLDGCRNLSLSSNNSPGPTAHSETSDDILPAAGMATTSQSKSKSKSSASHDASLPPQELPSTKPHDGPIAKGNDISSAAELSSQETQLQASLKAFQMQDEQVKASVDAEKNVPQSATARVPAKNVDELLIDPLFIKELREHAFASVADFAQARMTKEDIRLLIASIAETHKLGKTRTIVAILRLNAALEDFQDQQIKPSAD